jgi:autotransporter-associated beta strand protein
VTVGVTGTTSITLGSSVNTNGPSTATLNITGGSVTVGGNIVKGTTSGTVTSTLTLDGPAAVLDLGGKVIGAAGAGAIDNLNFKAGTLRQVAGINGGAGLTKTGPGIVTVDGANTYSGGTRVTTGTVLVSGSIMGNVTVSSDATFGGAGTVFTGPAGLIDVADRGVIAPGPDVTTDSGMGTLTIDAANTTGTALSLSSGATFSMQLDTGVIPSDTVALTHATTNSVVFAGNVINFSDLSAGQLSGSFTLFTADVAGAFGGLTTDANGFITAGLSIGTGLDGYYAAALQVVGNDIVLTNIPEPGSAATLLAGVGSLLGLQRFRRRAVRQHLV